MPVDAEPMPCVCGYDLRGADEDGRCPECGRAVCHMREAAAVRPAVAAWRRRVATGGGIVLAAWAVWAVAILATVRTAVGPVLPRLLAGPRPAVVLLLAVRRINPSVSSAVPVAAGGATVAFAVGLAWMTRLPIPLRTGRRMAAAWVVRAAAAGLFCLTLLSVPLTDRGSLGPSVRGLWIRAALGWDGCGTAAVWVAVGWLLAEAATGAGRPGLAVRVAGVFAVAAALAGVTATQYGPAWFAWPPYVRAFLPVVDAATSAAALILAGRFGVTAVWSGGRWWAWAGRPGDPDGNPG